MKKSKTIKTLKCPNHDLVHDNYCFIYEVTESAELSKRTLCLRCGYPKSSHKLQK